MYLICDVTSPHGEFMQNYGRELLVLCHYADETCDDKQCDDGNKMFLIFSHVNTRLKGYMNLWVEVRHGESLSRHV